MHKGISPKQLAQWGIFSALTVLCAWISLPFGEISFTLQTFALFLGLFTLGGKGGSIAFFVYLLMGAVGLPVFSGFQGGLGVLLGPTGGYLWGLTLACPVYWVMTHLGGQKAALSAAVLGLLLCYVCGTGWFLYLYGTETGWWAVAMKCILPFLLPDSLKLALAYSLSRRLRNLPSQ